MNLHGLVVYNEKLDALAYLQYNQQVSTIMGRSTFQIHLTDQYTSFISVYSDIKFLERDGWQVIGDMGDEVTVAQLN